MIRRWHRSACIAAIALAAATCTPTEPDRSDIYGFRLEPQNLVFRWPTGRLPVRYFAQNLGSFPDFVREGITLWESQFLYGEFQGALVSDSSQADVVVTLQGGTPPTAAPNDDPPLPACDGATATPLADPAHLAGPIVIRVRWFNTFAPTDVVNCLARVTAHEIGHSLGLLQHSSENQDLMFATPTVTTPSTRDRSTVQTLYHTTPDILPAAPAQ